ncbi:MAG: hypothetical protein MO852_14835, partial [Candidatus Devosia euplotis]|nr:hypothetical protein [Candidatus Devosia euplotis]
MADLIGEPTVTNRGRSALLSGTFEVSEVALGSASWSPGPTSNALQAETQRVAAQVQVDEVGPDVRLHVTAVDSGALDYSVREFALLDAAGDVLAIHSQADVIASKAQGSSLLMALDLVVADADQSSITAGDTSFALPTATENAAGIARRASASETVRGNAPYAFVSPVHLQRHRQDVLREARAVAEQASMLNALTEGPAAPGITCLAEKPGTGLMLAGGENSALYVSTDYGAAWTPATFANNSSGWEALNPHFRQALYDEVEDRFHVIGGGVYAYAQSAAGGLEPVQAWQLAHEQASAFGGVGISAGTQPGFIANLGPLGNFAGGQDFL